ncbi:MAG: DUF3943 domain-containing protein [Verrucomicrobiota bacterium]
MIRNLKISAVLLPLFCVGASPAQTESESSDDFSWLKLDPRGEGAAYTFENSERSLAYPIKYVLFYHAVGLAMLNELDRETTGFDSFSWDTYERNLKAGPHWDDDSDFFNYLMHPLWGSETYLRARSQRYSPLESFLFSTASSVVWEFGFESFVAQPSRQDLLITSTVGSLLGEFRYRLKHNLTKREGQRYRVLEILIDPLQGLTEWAGDRMGNDWREPAYHEIRETRRDTYVDIGPMIRPGGKLGLMLRYERLF